MMQSNCVVRVMFRQILAIVFLGIMPWMLLPAECGETLVTNSIELTAAHIEAANRRRRIILHHDVIGPSMRSTPWTKRIDQLDEVVAHFMQPYENDTAEYVDSVFYEWGEGYPAMWPSKILPRAKVEFPRWWDAGIDPIEVLLTETKKRKREVFFSYRINGGDVEGDSGYRDWKLPAIKQEHPEWLIQTPWDLQLWNFAIKEVRDYKVNILCEVAEMYDFDGIQVDLSRTPILFPAGTQWENRDHLTDFMRQLRLELLEVAKKRGRPLLMAVIIPENIVGCHFDGMDVEAWIRERLVDILVFGCGTSEIDIPAFRQLTAGTHIKLYPSWDPIHPTDGYREPPIEYWRGLYSKWWALGADGAHIRNLGTVSAGYVGISDRKPGTPFNSTDAYSPLLREIGDPEKMRFKDKAFIVERRSGSQGPAITGDPNAWVTPRHMYFETCMLAPLPAKLENDGKADTLLTVTVTDDLNVEVERVKDVTLRMLLSDPTAESLPANARLIASHMWTYTSHPVKNSPPAKGIEKQMEVRINNLLLEAPRVESGWLVWEVQPRQLALGDNLVGVRVINRPSELRDPIAIEKLELHVKFRTP